MAWPDPIDDTHPDKDSPAIPDDPADPTPHDGDHRAERTYMNEVRAEAIAQFAATNAALVGAVNAAAAAQGDADAAQATANAAGALAATANASADAAVAAIAQEVIDRADADALRLLTPTRRGISFGEFAATDGSPSRTFISAGVGTTPNRWQVWQYAEAAAACLAINVDSDYFYDWVTYRVEILLATTGSATAAPNNFVAFRTEHAIWTPGDAGSAVNTTLGAQTQCTLPTVANAAAAAWVSLGGGLTVPTADQRCKIGIRRTPTDPLDPSTNPVNLLGARLIKES